MTINLTRATAQAVVGAHAAAALEILGIGESIPASVDAGEASGHVASALGKIVEQVGVLEAAHRGIGGIGVMTYTGFIKTEDAVVDDFADLADDVDRSDLGELRDFAEKP